MTIDVTAGRIITAQGGCLLDRPVGTAHHAIADTGDGSRHRQTTDTADLDGGETIAVITIIQCQADQLAEQHIASADRCHLVIVGEGDRLTDVGIGEIVDTARLADAECRQHGSDRFKILSSH